MVSKVQARSKQRRSMEHMHLHGQNCIMLNFWLKKTTVSTTCSLNTLHDYTKNTWHLDIWGFVVHSLSDSVCTWNFAPGAIAFFNGLKNNQTLAQLVMELNPIGATGGCCDGFKGR